MNVIKQNAVMKRKKNDLQNLESKRKKPNTTALKNQKDPTEKRRMDEETGPNVLSLEALLRFAARIGDYETIASLNSIGVSVETENLRQRYCNHFGFYATPLHIAAGHGHVQCVEMLIQLGANVNAQANFGSTPLHVAIRRGHLPCVELLLKAGADCNLCMYCGSGSGDFPRFTTALHLAAFMNRPECVEYLIEQGADLEAVDVNGHTSLYIATRSGFSECVLKHLEHAPPSDFISTPCLETSNTPLHFAVENGMLHCVRKLVQLGADVNHLNNRGLSPLHMLFADPIRKRLDVMPILKALVLEGRDLDMNKVLHKNMFLEECYHEAITFLIAYGASLIIRSEWYNISMFKFILWRNAPLDLLNCFLNCLPLLPPLSSLNAPSFSLFSRFSVGLQSFIRVRLQKRLLLPLRQPHLDILYEIVSDELESRSSVDVSDLTPDRQRSTLLTREYLRELQLQLFYEKEASTPRSLQQCCRFAIRQCMAPASLKHVGKLPLPENLKSYLLFGFHNPDSI